MTPLTKEDNPELPISPQLILITDNRSVTISPNASDVEINAALKDMNEGTTL
jgi:hypothetical protein